MKKISSNKKPAILIKKLNKEYILHHHKPTFMGTLFGLETREKFLALDNVSLKINKGEKVGIIGHNGSGKTTLLKVISEITHPTSGKVKSFGRVTSLIGLSAGFHPELTGRENIYVNGLVIGMHKKEIKGKIKEIIDFSGLKKFIDTPLFTYSTGMMMRLGFSVAVHSDPEILLLDEGVTTGDKNFQDKSKEKITEFYEQDKTIVIVSHWLDFLEKNVDRVIWLDMGKVKMDGKSKKIINLYKKDK